MSYRLYIFDFSGTLADSAAWLRHELPRLAGRHRFPAPSPDALEGLRGRGGREIVRRLGIPAWKRPAIRRDLRRRSHRAIQYVAPYPGVADMLTRLHRAGVRIAVVSSNTEHNIREMLGPGPAACVSHYVCGKPLLTGAARLRRSLKAASVAPADALVIGDEPRDLAAARQVGVAAGAVTWGYGEPAALAEAGAAHMFETPGDIASLAAPRPLRVRRRAEPATA